jgi:hypothetical protein
MEPTFLCDEKLGDRCHQQCSTCKEAEQRRQDKWREEREQRRRDDIGNGS